MSDADEGDASARLAGQQRTRHAAGLGPTADHALSSLLALNARGSHIEGLQVRLSPLLAHATVWR